VLPARRADLQDVEAGRVLRNPALFYSVTVDTGRVSGYKRGKKDDPDKGQSEHDVMHGCIS
jgi:hypothetical protein